jgi:hypothetical protein
MADPYRVPADAAKTRSTPTSKHTLWAKLRHWFLGFGCSHMGSRSSVLHPGEHAIVVHKCDRCGDIVQIDWFVGGKLDDRWP